MFLCVCLLFYAVFVLFMLFLMIYHLFVLLFLVLFFYVLCVCLFVSFFVLLLLFDYFVGGCLFPPLCFRFCVPYCFYSVYCLLLFIMPIVLFVACLFGLLLVLLCLLVLFAGCCCCCCCCLFFVYVFCLFVCV